MKAFEAAKKQGMEAKEFCKEHGIKSHLSKISAELEAELFGDEKKTETEQAATETVDSAETVIVGAPAKDEVKPEKPVEESCPVDLATLELSIRGRGGKSPYYKWKHLLNG